MDGQLRLVSFLGLGTRRKPEAHVGYQETTYEWADSSASGAGPRVCRTPFTARALAELAGAQELIVLATDKAREDSGGALEAALAAAGLPAPCFLRLPDGKNEAELWQAFAVIHDALCAGAGTQVVLDVTHGFRTLPFFAASVVAFLRAVGDDSSPPRILYAAFDAKTPEGHTPVWELTTFLDVVSWGLALHLFLRTGRAEGVSAPTKALAERLRRSWAAGGRVGAQPTLGRLAARLEAFGEDLATVRTGALLLGSRGRVGTAAELLDDLVAARGEVAEHLPPLAVVLDRVRRMVEPLTANVPAAEHRGAQSVRPLDTAEGHRAVHALASLYLDLERYAEAAATTREGWINLCGTARATLSAAGTFDESARTEAQTRWYRTTEHRELSEVRNDIQHAGYRKQPLPARSLRERLRLQVEAFGAASAISAPRPGSGAAVFLNLSNHPSAAWEERQIAAARALAPEIVDVPFPTVAPEARHIGDLVARVLDVVPGGATHAMVMGEHTTTVGLVQALQMRGVTCFAATTRRDIADHGDGTKTVRFDFVAFREYPVLASSEERVTP